VLICSAFLAYSLGGRSRRIYLPGPTSDGHYQIELECNACHTKAFADRETLQQACVRCHGAELREANDSHPERKFTDPRNAGRAKLLDARHCVTCHREHRPELTSTMGLSLPLDYCYRCHESVAEERPSHVGLGFEICASAGCHNFHDNRALYEDYLVRHLDEPNHHPSARGPERTATREAGRLELSEADAPRGVELAAGELRAWHESAHARERVNCSGCHVPEPADGRFSKKVADATCKGCHEREYDGFTHSRHGMRVGLGLPKLSVAEARRPMKAASRERELGCTSCHGGHAFDTRRAAAQACVECHDDGHSRSHAGSKHARLWASDPSGQSGASCATCHLPRVRDGQTVRVIHNQNDTLRPNEKMARSVCQNCHGLGFVLDALADNALIARNFNGMPLSRVRSLEMVRARLLRH
jgi:hypothetical protein